MLTRLPADLKEGPHHMDICATFRMTAREYRSAMRNSPAFRCVLIGCALIAAVGLISLPFKGPGVELYIGLGLGLPVFLEMVVRQAARRSATLFAEPWLVRVTDETFTLRTAVSQAETGWNAYSAAWERSGFWYLRQINGASCFIPQRAFDDAQQDGLAEFFTRRLPPPKIHWYNPRSWR
jgi:YcxB-like protein